VLETPIALTNTFSVAPWPRRRSASASRPTPRRAAPAHGQPAGVRVQRRLPQRHPAHGRDRGRLPAGLQAAERGLRAGLGRRGARHVELRLKGGIGSASRRVSSATAGCTVGALVLANYGQLPQLLLAGHASATGLRHPRQQRTPAKSPRRARSSCWSPPTRRSTRASCAAWRCAPAPGWRARARSSATAAATSRWPFPPPTPCRSKPIGRCRPSRCCTTASSTACSRPRPTAPSRPSCMRCGAPRPSPAATATTAPRWPAAGVLSSS
jgi:hypothetical protein